MGYWVQVVGDRSLPEGVEFVFARQAGQTYLFVRRSALAGAMSGRCNVLTRAWECWQAAEREDVLRGLRTFASA